MKHNSPVLRDQYISVSMHGMEAQGGQTLLTVREAIHQRRAIRSFRADPVPEELLQEVLGAARLAPSSFNLQPWRFVVVKSHELRQGIAEAARNQTSVIEAPLIIICCAEQGAYDNERVLRLLDELPQVPPVCVSPAPNTFIAIAYMTLMATALGLGTVWVGGFNHEKVHELLGLPANIIPVSLLPLGYSAADPDPRERKPMDEIVLT